MSNNFTFVVKLLHEINDQVFTEVIISLLVARKPETFNVTSSRIGKNQNKTTKKGEKFIPLTEKTQKNSKKGK